MSPNWSFEVQRQVDGFSLNIGLAGGTKPVALIGPNGAGKTTLLRILAGALTPDTGRFQLGDQVLYDSAMGLNVPPEGRRVGFVPQGYGLFPHLSVLENVAFGLRTRFSSKEDRDRIACEMLVHLGCDDLASRRPRRLSGGEAQRVALARALVVAPQILLLDEPLSALDASHRRRMRRFLSDHFRAEPRPSKLVTHDPRDVRAIQPHVAVIEQGRVVQQGSCEQLEQNPATDFVAEFFS